MAADPTFLSITGGGSTGRAPEIAPLDLALQLEAGATLQILDVRAPFRLAGGHIDLGPPERFLNLAGSELLGLPDPAAAGLERDLPVVAVCGRGNDSQRVALHLGRHGYTALSLAGGMQAWMKLLVPRELPAPAGFDRLVQFDRVGKGALSYLLSQGNAALAIDVPRQTAAIEAAALQSGAQLVAVVETHAHADYLSGGAELARRSGTAYYLHPADAASPYDGTPGRLAYSALQDGQELAVGRGRIQVRHTPGHTLGSVTLLAGDAAAFTGDFLFIESIGRPDLAGRTAEWAPLLYASLDRARRAWPDNLLVYPAHYASAGERNADRSIGRPLGELKTSNVPLQLPDAAQFTAWVQRHLSTPPPAYQRIKLANLGLDSVEGAAADELESGKNECAVS
jgi:glyoxylase-like metal-dependent hydrolase (beta-lactamase superfamily II)